MNDENFFDKTGLEIQSGNVEVGGTYPVYGMITSFLDDTVDNVIVEINYNMDVKLTIPSEDKIQLLKERAFEPGIFVCTIDSKNEKEKIKASCSTVIFGKRQCKDVQ